MTSPKKTSWSEMAKIQQQDNGDNGDVGYCPTATFADVVCEGAGEGVFAGAAGALLVDVGEGAAEEAAVVKGAAVAGAISGSLDDGASNEHPGSFGETPLTHLHDAARKKLSNRRVTLGVVIFSLVALALIVVVGQVVTPQASVTDFASKNLPPSLQHPFGTDWMGRDMFLRTLAGLSTSVLVSLLAAGVSSVIALILGVAAALGGKKVDAVVTWLIDLLMGVPHIVLLILISYALGKGFWGVTIGVALTHWANLARVVRAEVLQCKESTFVAVSRKLGVPRMKIALQHIVPYVFPQFIVGLILLFPHAILHEAAITFLGFGLPPEQPAIGIILSESMNYLISGMWWLAVFPGLALIGTVMLFDLAGSHLRKLVDPFSSQE